MIYMYVEFHPYTSILHIFRKTYFDASSSWFQVLFLSKLFLGFNVKKTKILFICVLDSIHTHYASNEFKNPVFVFVQVWKNQISI